MKLIKTIILCLAIVFISLTVYAQNITIAYYTMDGCPWCVKQKPVLDRVVKDKNIRMTITENYSPSGIFPTIEIKVNGKVIKTLIGFTPYDEIVKYL